MFSKQMQNTKNTALYYSHISEKLHSSRGISHIDLFQIAFTMRYQGLKNDMFSKKVQNTKNTALYYSHISEKTAFVARDITSRNVSNCTHNEILAPEKRYVFKKIQSTKNTAWYYSHISEKNCISREAYHTSNFFKLHLQ